MRNARDLWREKVPYWLVKASRSCALYPTKTHIDLPHLEHYIQQFSQKNAITLNEHALASLHPGHHTLFRFFADDAVDLHNVFSSAYATELLQQARAAWGHEAFTSLNAETLTRSHIEALMNAHLKSAVRDLSVLEHHHLTGTIDAEAYDYGVRSVSSRMDRAGVNGIDRLLHARPELDEFLKNDSTVINVGHFPLSTPAMTKTRAASYNTAQNTLRGFSFEDKELTRLREDVISPTFGARKKQLSEYLSNHIVDVPKPTASTRHKYAPYGHLQPNETGNTPVTDALLHVIPKGDMQELQNYYGFLIHDGIALNHEAQFNVHAPSKPKKPIDVDAMVIEPQKPSKSHTPEVAAAPLVLEHHATSSITKPADDKSIDSPSQSLEQTAPATSHVAKVAALGGAASALGLLLTSKKDPARDEHSSDEKDHAKKSQALKRTAFAVSTTVSLGGIVAWSRKPDFLYKRLREVMDKLFDPRKK